MWYNIGNVLIYIGTNEGRDNIMTTKKETTKETVRVSYLDNNGASVKKILVRSTTTIDRAKSVVEDNLYKAKGTLMYYRKLSDSEFFSVLSFEDPIMLMAWEAITSTELGKIPKKDGKVQTIDVRFSKVLVISDETGNDQKAMERMERIKASLVDKYEAAVLEEEKVEGEEAKYQLILLFTNEVKMHEFEQTFDVQNS